MTEEAVAQAQVQGQAVHGHGELGQGLYANPELRARAAAIMSNAALLNNTTAAVTGNANGARYLDDETEGSSDEQPPTVCIPSLSPCISYSYFRCPCAFSCYS